MGRQVIQEKRVERFNQVKQELIDDGYQETVISISALKANVMVLVTSFPIALFLMLVYELVHGRAAGFSKFSLEFVIFFCGFLAAIVVHELIHGITWSHFCKKGWKSIHFGVIWKFLTPYCSCDEVLIYKGYLLGAAMPTILLGLLPYAVSLVAGIDKLMLLSLVMIVCGGGDLYLIWKIRKKKRALIIDHPVSIGCVAFEKI